MRFSLRNAPTMTTLSVTQSGASAKSSSCNVLECWIFEIANANKIPLSLILCHAHIHSNTPPTHTPSSYKTTKLCQLLATGYGYTTNKFSQHCNLKINSRHWWIQQLQVMKSCGRKSKKRIIPELKFYSWVNEVKRTFGIHAQWLRIVEESNSWSKNSHNRLERANINAWSTIFHSFWLSTITLTSGFAGISVVFVVVDGFTLIFYMHDQIDDWNACATALDTLSCPSPCYIGILCSVEWYRWQYKLGILKNASFLNYFNSKLNDRLCIQNCYIANKCLKWEWERMYSLAVERKDRLNSSQTTASTLLWIFA